MLHPGGMENVTKTVASSIRWELHMSLSTPSKVSCIFSIYIKNYMYIMMCKLHLAVIATIVYFGWLLRILEVR